MAYLTANGVAVSEGRLTLPLVGRGVASLSLEPTDVAFAQGDPVELTFDGSITYRMAVQRVGLEHGSPRLLLVAGAGGLSKVLAPKAYAANVAGATVVRDVLREAGEAAGDVDVPGSFVHWVRGRAPAYASLDALMATWSDRAWRVKRDGKVWVGRDAWPAGPAVVVTERRALAGAAVLEVAPALEPGVELAELGRVVRVVHDVSKARKTEVWTA
jgi:hypothetical protein